MSFDNDVLFKDKTLEHFIENKIKVLFSDPELKRLLAKVHQFEGRDESYHNFQEDESVIRFSSLIQEVHLVLKFIDGYYKEGSALLEIGGGVGIINAYLQCLGIDIISLEPSEQGHDNNFRIGEIFIKKLGLKCENWLPYTANKARELNKKFDLIFSNNVIEHIDNLEETFSSLTSCLKPGGIMRHNCPNYTVPYEPHFGIPLIPFKPEVTKYFTAYSQTPLWKSINFITHRDIKKLSKKFGLIASFEKQTLHRTLYRLESSSFHKRHKLPYIFFKILRFSGLINIIKYLPASLSTPMHITFTKL